MFTSLQFLLSISPPRNWKTTKKKPKRYRGPKKIFAFWTFMGKSIDIQNILKYVQFGPNNEANI